MPWDVYAHLLANRALDSLSRSATVVVAASDSKHKEAADYVCTGNNDQDTIMEAINSLPSYGGTVQLLEGNYHNSKSIVIERENVTLEGAGRATRIHTETWDDDNYWSAITINPGTNGVCIKDIYWNGNETSFGFGLDCIDIWGESENEVQNLHITGCHFHDFGSTHVYGLQMVNGIIEGNIFTGSGNYAVDLEVISNYLILDNVCMDSSGEIHLYSMYNTIVKGNITKRVQVDTANYCAIVDNIISGGGGSTFYRCYYTSISRNILIGMYMDAGILLGYGSANNVVQGNTIYGYSGIGLNEVDSNIVIGNQIVSPTSHGITLASAKNSIIAGNLIKDSGGHGIYSYGESDRNLIMLNNINGCNDGVRLDSTVNRHFVYHNFIYNYSNLSVNNYSSTSSWSDVYS